jgi:hypothetical protein
MPKKKKKDPHYGTQTTHLLAILTGHFPTGKVKVTLTLCVRMAPQKRRGEVYVEFHTFLTFALNGGE